MRVRFQKGSLKESLESMFEPKNWEDFCEHCIKEFEETIIDSITCEHYFNADERLGWNDTWIIKACFKNDVDNYKYPIGYSDESIFSLKGDNKTSWRTDEPPKDEDLELLCVLFNEDSYRTLKKDSWGRWNRTINKGRWNGHHFTGYVGHQSGDPFPSVVAWRPLNKEDMGEEYYPKCLGEFLDY